MDRCGRWHGLAGMVLAALALHAGALPAQTLEGTVLSSFTGDPIPAATLRLVDEEGAVIASTRADAAGRFRLRPPAPGAYYLHGEALGYFSMVEGPFDIVPDADPVVELTLRPSPLALDSLRVSVEARNPRLEQNGFYGRLGSGQGFQLDRREIADRPSARTVSDLLRGVPGVQVDNRGYVRLRGMSSIRGRCYYKVYLDGVLVVSRTSWDEEWPRWLIRPEDIEGLEVYRRPSEIPVRYAGAESGCGVVLIWSRRGGGGPGPHG